MAVGWLVGEKKRSTEKVTGYRVRKEERVCRGGE